MLPCSTLKPHWRFPVHIRIVTPDDPLAAKIQHESVSALADGKTLKIEAVLPSSDPDAREFIQRQFVTALLWERFFAADHVFDSQTRLDVVPFWLREGLREWISDDSGRDRRGNREAGPRWASVRPPSPMSPAGRT